MDAEFWHQKWQDNQIGFHQSDVNKALVEFWPDILSAARFSAGNVKSCVFVPLCGKSLDMIWLQQQGHRVLGVELSHRAANAFFTENELSFEQRQEGVFECFHGTGSAEGITIMAGDFFKLTSAHTAGCSLFYDRASLIAMKPDMRADYVDQISNLTAEGTTGLLQTLAYDQSLMKGPPFSVSDESARLLLSPCFDIKEIAHYSGPERVGTLAARGLETMDERVYLLHRKP